MTDDWDFYSALVDDKPASIYVDLGAEALAPVAALSHMAYLRLRMRQPRDDGLSSQAEFDQLIVIEDALEAALCDDLTAYVGRNTSDGCRDFYFYVSAPDTWTERVAATMKSFPDYEFQEGVREDREWSSYRNFLQPSPWDHERIQNRRVCEQLEHNGDKLTAPREIDHLAWLPNAASATAFIDELRPLGYQLKHEPTHDDERDAIRVHLARVDVPSMREIDEVIQPVYDAAQRHGGEYDGWGCTVIA
ncbi:DUF695 domain-containing protein [Mitsuaria sp. 7]|uniref:DUF695 domain-containing protein n=1 Tax=Mitsuaria sp. 7 TaxID=1658665 RepID=UPI0007DDA529|nr:DUF695 domain-containing protein [Mitsuaria sp. 7]ANH67134.1 hypothetical protein ABE85_05315 [Mitsuaria sp. 7]